MRSMKVVDGDLVIGPGRRADMVEGEEKLLQDLSLWLMEPLGVGETTPSFGSQLPDLIGQADPNTLTLEVQTEVSRLLSLYQANQLERLRSDRDAGLLSNWTKAELLDEIVDVSAITDGLDRVLVTAKIRNAVGATVDLSLSVDDDEVSVS